RGVAGAELVLDRFDHHRDDLSADKVVGVHHREQEQQAMASPRRHGRRRVHGLGRHAPACAVCFARARLSAVSSIMSSCPPTMPRRPISTRISRAGTPYFFSARLANNKKEPYTPA